MDTRIEKDSMGEMTVPAKAYWGAQTQRAVENFPVSGYRPGAQFVRALGLVKGAAAKVNKDLGRLDGSIADLIVQAAGEVADGKLCEHFVLDVFQTGSGTSSNMNANEVISNRAIELSGGKIGSRDPVHPNDHVNMGQSSNDVIPTAIHVAIAEAIKNELVPALGHLKTALDEKAKAFGKVVKIGRTHLMDATPVTLGQEFSGYARQAELGGMRCEKAIKALRELPIGGTAVGSGINTHAEFGARVSAELASATGIGFTEADNHFEAQATKDGICEASGLMRTVAVSMLKIASDIRLLGSGPRCGLGEIALPSTQPGSSIMPGKVNPVMCEMVCQVAAQVIGYDTTVTHACRESFLELNVGMPLIAYNMLESVRLLSSAATIFGDRCVKGIEANEDRCKELIEYSLAMCTSLAPIIGYDKAAAVAKEAFASGKTVRQVAMEQNLMPEAELSAALDPTSMTRPDSA